MGKTVFSSHVRNFLSFLRIECGLSPHTMEAYGRDLRDLESYLEAEGGKSVEVQAIHAEDLAGHLRWLRTERNLSASSICRHLASIRMFFRFLSANQVIGENPAVVLERPTRWQRLPDVLTPHQIKRLLSAPDASQGVLGYRDRALLELMYAAGLRATETVSVRLSDWRPTLGVVQVLGKGQRERLVPIGRPAEQAIEAYLGQARPVLIERAGGMDCERLLLSRTGRALERIAVWQIVRRQAKAAGLSDVHPHQIRHSFATHLMMGGADLRIVQELLGHADIQTTQTYTHVDSKRLRQIHQQYHPRS